MGFNNGDLRIKQSAKNVSSRKNKTILQITICNMVFCAIINNDFVSEALYGK